MSFPNAKGAQVFPADTGALVKSRIKSLPARARERIKFFERADAEREVRSELNWTRIQDVQRKLADARHYLAKLRRYDERGQLFTGKVRPADDGSLETMTRPAPHLLTEEQEEIDELTAEIQRLQEESKAPNPLPSIENVYQWLAGLPSGASFREYVPDVELRKGESAFDAFLIRREAIADFQEQAKAARDAPLTANEALSHAIADIEAKAAEGAPDFRPVFKLYDRFPGNVQWPVDYLTESKTFDRGVAFVCWLFKDDVIARVKKEIAQIACPDSALTVQERKLRQEEIARTVLELEREEVVLLDRVRAEGRHDVGYRHATNMLALLQIAPV